MLSLDDSANLQASVNAALENGMPLRIRGGGTKDFLGHPCNATPLDMRRHRGVIDHQPGELMVNVRAGTPLAELNAALAREGQQLPFEPPAFGTDATIGGTLACNLSGPARPHGGAARDAMLGVRMLNGRGEIVEFGGQVMKNVAGYDLTRLMAGAMGTLGVLLDVYLKLVPMPEQTTTRVLELDAETALRQMREWHASPLPVTATCHDGHRLYVRLAGTADCVGAAARRIGGEEPADTDFWRDLREHRLSFFDSQRPLWRISVAANAPVPDLPGDCLIEWGGNLRWYRGDAGETEIRDWAQMHGGHASCWRGHAAQAFHPLSGGLFKLHRKLKQAFDPAGIFNPGRLYPEL